MNTHINMQPNIVFLTNISNGIYWIKSTVNSCSCSAVDKEWLEPPPLVLLHQHLQMIRIHPSSLINIHLSTVLQAKSNRGSCPFQGVMTL